jgi:hypothetical protein
MVQATLRLSPHGAYGTDGIYYLYDGRSLSLSAAPSLRDLPTYRWSSLVDPISLLLIIFLLIIALLFIIKVLLNKDLKII